MSIGWVVYFKQFHSNCTLCKSVTGNITIWFMHYDAEVPNVTYWRQSVMAFLMQSLFRFHLLQMTAKIADLETNSKIKNIRDLFRGISDFKKGYQPRTNIVNDETGDLVTGSYSILASWRDYFSRLLNVHGVHDIRQRETHRAEPLVPEPSAFEVDLAIEKLNLLKPTGHVMHQQFNLLKPTERRSHLHCSKSLKSCLLL